MTRWILALSAALTLAWPNLPAAHSKPKNSTALQNAAVKIAPLPAAYPRLLQAKKYAALLAKLRSEPSDLGGRKAFLLGYALLQTKRHGDAITHFEEAIRKTPALAAHALFFLAQAYQGAGDGSGALRAFRKMLRRDSRSMHAPEALERIAQIEMEEGRPGAAAGTLNLLLRRFPGHERFAVFLARKARAHELAGNYRAAALSWRRLWLERGESPEARGALEKAESFGLMARPPLAPMGAKDFYRRARGLQKRYYYQEAYDTFQLLKSRFPGSPYRRQVILNEALTLYALRRTGRARPALERAIELYPVKSSDRAKARYHLMRNHLRAKDRTGFSEDSRLLLEESPRGKWAARGRYLQARVHEDSGRYEDASRYYKEVIRIHPGSPLVPKAMWQLAWIQYRLGRFQEAQRKWKKLGRRFPNHWLASSALYWSAAAAEKSGKRSEAAARYRRTVQIYRHRYFGHLAMRALERLKQSGNLDAVRPIPLAAAGFAEWTRPPAAPLGKSRKIRWRTAELLASMGFYRLAGEEFFRLGSQPFFRYHAARAFARGEDAKRAIGILRKNFWPAIQGGGKDLPPEFWKTAFPLRLKRKLSKGAEPLLVNSIIMAESAFDPDAFSRAGAIGLMQLMPATGRRLARIHKVRLKSTRDLFNPKINVNLGARHLGSLIRRFKGALVPAIASYNAGQTPVKRWWRARGGDSIEVFIQRIPYEETRKYVQRVLSYYWEYQRIYARTNQRPPRMGQTP